MDTQLSLVAEFILKEDIDSAFANPLHFSKNRLGRRKNEDFN